MYVALTGGVKTISHSLAGKSALFCIPKQMWACTPCARPTLTAPANVNGYMSMGVSVKLAVVLVVYQTKLMSYIQHVPSKWVNACNYQLSNVTVQYSACT